MLRLGEVVLGREEHINGLSNTKCSDLRTCELHYTKQTPKDIQNSIRRFQGPTF